MGPLIQRVKVPLEDIPSLKYINCPTQLGIICQFSEGPVNPTVYILNKDNEQYWSQNRLLMDTSCN